MDKFWMVIKKDGAGSDQTSFRHSSLDGARAEAWRLSQLHRAEFVILEATERMLEPWAAQLKPVLHTQASDQAINGCSKSYYPSAYSKDSDPF
ncbi:hypothetical protein [Roseibium album]|uniref:hypothetical protein n=1 Tax=Roseibium album TaxID=311410 RepID=UPI002490BB11|nr:hypothetical protein [Roseibium album]